MASKTDNRVLPNKEAALFRQLAKQYEVGRPAIAPSCMPPAAGRAGSVIGLPGGAGSRVALPSDRAPTPPTSSPPSWVSRRRCRRCRCRPTCRPLLPHPAPLLLPQTKQYKKGVKNADTILKKFPDHGETLAMKVHRMFAAPPVLAGSSQRTAASRLLLAPPPLGHARGPACLLAPTWRPMPPAACPAWHCRACCSTAWRRRRRLMSL